MKDLKCGDFVWSKTYGNGIVYSGGYNAYEILFEGQDAFIYSVRSDLFAKGDEVEVMDWDGDGTFEGTFLGITHYSIYNKNSLIIKKINGFCYYISDIKHKVTDKLEVILTMNGKEIDAKTISKETWDNLRRIV